MGEINCWCASKKEEKEEEEEKTASDSQKWVLILIKWNQIRFHTLHSFYIETDLQFDKQ